MTIIDVVESRESHIDPADHFNDMMSRTETQISAIEAIRALNPAFVAKVQAAIIRVSKSRNEANAQHAAIREALVEAFPDDDERHAITNWFVYVAMAIGYGQAQKMLMKFTESAGDPSVVPPVAAPAPQLLPSTVPGYRLGPWKSPARGRAIKAVASLGNPHGAGRVFKLALERFAETTALLSPTTGMDPQATNLVRSALENDAIDVTIEGGSDELLRASIEPYGDDTFGCSVAADIAVHWRSAIEDLLKHKLVRFGSVQYWASTLEKLGLDPSNYEA